jgi:membrane-associated phospholipid phosphatase
MIGKTVTLILSIAAVMIIVAQGFGSTAELCLVAPPLLSQESVNIVPADTRQHHKLSSSRYLEYGLGAVGVETALFLLDEEVKDLSQWDRLHAHAINHVAGEFGNLGTQKLYVATGALLVGYSALARNWKGVFVTGELAAGFLLEEGITQADKAIFGRLRPYRTDSQFQFFHNGTSFTSGHAATVFTFATIMAKSYPRQNLEFLGIDHDVPLVPVLSYTAAGLVGLQRMYVNAHWSSDVFGGALIGYGVGSAVVYMGRKIHFDSLAIILCSTPMISASFEFGGR